MFEKTCKDCPLADLRCRIPGSGPEDADMLFLGESPGEQEIKRGKCFVGPSGFKLNSMFRQAKIRRSSIRLDNVVQCPLGKSEGQKLPKAVAEACRPRLVEEIKRISPRIIVPMGKIALSMILGHDIGIESERGQTFISKEFGCKVLPTYHPAHVLRAWQNEKLVVRDFCLAMEECKQRRLIRPDFGKYTILRTFEEVKELCQQLQEVKEFTFDLETTGLDRKEDIILSISFSTDERNGFCIPIFSEKQEIWNPKQRRVLWSFLRKVLEGPAKKVAQNFEFDCLFLKEQGIEVNNVYFDPMLAAHLLDENLSPSLDTLSQLHTRMGRYERKVRAYLPNKQASFSLIPDEELWEYNCKDTDCTFRVKNILQVALRKEHKVSLYRNIVLPMAKVLMRVHEHGTYVDRAKLLRVSKELREQRIGVEKEFLKLCNFKSPEEFNYRSTKQLRELLFDTLKFKHPKRTEKGAKSTDKEVLEDLAYEHEVPRVVLKLRGIDKLIGTYLDGKDGKGGILPLIDGEGRLHANFKITGTTTGRLSCAKPNLQNIPRDSIIRTIFASPPGYKLIDADYSSAELRSLVLLSGDTKLEEALASGDVHTATAVEMFGKESSEVTEDDRWRAKMVVYGIIYGRGPQSLAQQMHCTISEAQKYLENFFHRFQKVKEFIKECHYTVEREGEITSLFGRTRHLYGIFSTQGPVKASILRQAQNFPIQSPIADLSFCAAIEANDAFRKQKMRSEIVNLIHDSIMVESPEEETEEAAGIVKEAMEREREGLQIPVDLEVVDCWGEKK